MNSKIIIIINLDLVPDADYYHTMGVLPSTQPVATQHILMPRF